MGGKQERRKKKCNPFICRLFLIMIVLCMMAEVGGIIALSVFNKTVRNKTNDQEWTLLSAILRDYKILIIISLSRLRTYCTWVGRRSIRNPKISSSER